MTALQQRVYDWIAAYVAEHGAGPTTDEVRGAFGWTAKQTRDILWTMRDEGHLRCGRARTCSGKPPCQPLGPPPL